jgi:hypothetical protein
MVRKRRERKRGKHSASDEDEVVDQEDGAKVTIAEPPETEPEPVAEHIADDDVAALVGGKTRVEAAPSPEPEQAPEPEPEPAPAVDAERKDVPETGSGLDPVAGAEPTDEAAVAAATSSPSAPTGAVTQELESLTKLLEQSLSGGSQGPVPNVSTTWTVEEALAPPQINATPEDILGVQAQHLDPKEAAPQETAEGPEQGAQLPGSGTGAKPMEAFEERAQMAKEVLRATGNNPRSLRSDEQVSESRPHSEPVGEDEPSPEEERDENVRFSEDLTISSKRRRRLFGR